MKLVDADTGDTLLGLPYVTPFTYDWEDYPVDVWPPSIVNEDHNMSVEFLMDRFVRNIAVPRQEVVNTDIDVSDYDRMDTIERTKAANDLRKRNAAHREKIMKDVSDIKAKEEAEAFENEVKKRADVLAEARAKKGDIGDGGQ